MAAVMLVVSTVIVGKACRTRRRRQEGDEVVIIQDMNAFMEVSVSINSQHSNN